jgi:hypothetical protein
MPPPGFAHAGSPADLPPCIAAILKAGWRLAGEAGAFESAAGERLDFAPELPAGSRVVYTVSSLATADPARLSAPERELARHVRIILTRDADVAQVLARVQRWACIERAQVAPQAALP